VLFFRQRSDKIFASPIHQDKDGADNPCARVNSTSWTLPVLLLEGPCVNEVRCIHHSASQAGTHVHISCMNRVHQPQHTFTLSLIAICAHACNRFQHPGTNPLRVFHQGKGGILHIFSGSILYGETAQKMKLQ